MKLTTKSEYSILALIYIARNQKKGLVKIEAISSHYDIPHKYLEQLLLALKQNGLLKAKRGSKGGYSLALDANKINIASIIRLMDGALASIDSASSYFFSNTPLEKESKIMDALKEIRLYTSNKLEKLKLSNLL